MRLFTSAEAAAYLRLKERKLYELVAERAIPCTKVTGRWLFPKIDLDNWVLASMDRPAGLARPAPPPIVGGSHDPLIEWALRDSGSGLAILAEGSEAGLARFRKGEVVGAAIHLHAIGEPQRDANVDAVRDGSGLQGAVLIALLRREQGLLVARGNPLGIAGLNDVAERHARIAQRQRGAGAQLLLLSLLVEAGYELEALEQGPMCPTGSDLAHAVQTGKADCGIATRSAAAAAQLDFVPLMWERFDFVTQQRDYFSPPLQRFFAFARTPAFARRAAEMTGYDTDVTGSVRCVP